MQKRRPTTWSPQCDRESRLEGWILFGSNGIIQLRKLDEADMLDGIKFSQVVQRRSDREALTFVVSQAILGVSKRYILALYLLGQVDNEFIFIPANLRGI